MPHSGGGGSHGGGSHGGSHGSRGSSSRISHTYFPGSRRYVRRNRITGKEEYFYSNGRPARTSLASIIFLIIFGGFFSVFMGAGISTSIPHRLKEKYRVPDTRVYDYIDVLTDEEEESIEDLLEDINDRTGICPVFKTIYIDEYREDYGTLESYAYDLYVDEYADEQHYLVVYAIWQDEAEDYRSGRLEVPDYEWEIMQGDDTDPIMSERIDNSFISAVQDDMEEGLSVGRSFANGFEKLKRDTDRKLSNRFAAVIPVIIAVVFMGLLFLPAIIVMIRGYVKDRNADIEEVPLKEEDTAQSVKAQSIGTAVLSADAAGHVVKGVKLVSILFLIPFILAGIGIMIGGINAIKGKDPSGVMLLVFGFIWNLIIVITAISLFKTISARKKDSAPLNAEYPKAQMPYADAPNAEYPDAEYPAAEYSHKDEDRSPFLRRRSDYDDDDDGLRRKGYE